MSNERKNEMERQGSQFRQLRNFFVIRNFAQMFDKLGSLFKLVFPESKRNYIYDAGIPGSFNYQRGRRKLHGYDRTHNPKLAKRRKK